MNYVFLMKDLDCSADLSYYTFYGLLLQWLAFLLANVVEQVAVGHEPCHHIVSLAVLEDFDELEEVLTINASHLLRNLQLLESLIVFRVD